MAACHEVAGLHLPVMASMAWESASMPVVAVCARGSVTVSSGSTMAQVVLTNTLHLALTSEREMTATFVTSLPVPAVVGTRMTGVFVSMKIGAART